MLAFDEKHVNVLISDDRIYEMRRGWAGVTQHSDPCHVTEPGQSTPIGVVEYYWVVRELPNNDKL